MLRDRVKRSGVVIVRTRRKKKPTAPVSMGAVAQHRHFFGALKRAKGHKKLVAIAFLALTVFNIIYAFTEPAQAYLFDDLTGAGRAAGDAIMKSSYTLVTELYNGKYGILPWLSKTCLYFATPVAAAGIVQYVSEEVPDNPIKRPVIWGTIFLVVALSGGGYVMGQIYLFIFHILEGFFQKMDEYMTLYNTIEQGKAYLASNAMISAATAECGKLVGQEQQGCISEAAAQALGTLKDFESRYGLAEWLKGRQDILEKIRDDVLSPDKSLIAQTANTFFYVFAKPAAETAQAAAATASITAFMSIYAAVMAYMGLGGPIAGLSSLLVPGLQSGWVVWLLSIFGLWFWRVSYMALLWFSSKTLVNAVPSNLIGTAWFTLGATILAPVIAGGIAGGGAFAIWGGITSFAGGALSTVTAGMGSPSLVNAGQPPAQSAPTNNSASYPQGGPTPQVNTDY